MTSGNDDLEDALRQNLKIRRELAAKVAKAKGGGITYRLGWVLYWICLGAYWIVVGILLHRHNYPRHAANAPR